MIKFILKHNKKVMARFSLNDDLAKALKLGGDIILRIGNYDEKTKSFRTIAVKEI